MNRRRKESIEIYDKDKQIPEIERYMMAYIDTSDKDKPLDLVKEENSKIDKHSGLSPEKDE